MFANEYRERFDAVRPDAEFAARLKERMDDEMIRKYVNCRKMSLSVAAALVALLVLATGALATGVLRSVFGNFREDLIFSEGFVADIDLQALSGLLDVEPQAQKVAFVNGAKAEVTLAEHYFNGRMLVLGWAMTNDAEVPAITGQDEFVPPKGNPVTALPSWIGEADAAEFQRRYEKEGWACVSYVEAEMDRYVYILSDAAEPYDMLDGRGPVSGYIYSGDPKEWQESGTTYMIDSEVHNMLPQQISEMDLIDVARHVSGVVHYCYQDETGIYSGVTEREWHMVRMPVARNTQIAEKVQISSVEFPNHTARIAVTASPVQIAISIESLLPEEDVQMYRDYMSEFGNPFIYPKNLENDIVDWYNLYIDGVKTEGGWHFNGRTQLEHFIAPDKGFAELTLRPVYCNSGEHPEEEIVIQLPE